MFEEFLSSIPIAEVNLPNCIFRKESFEGPPHEGDRGCCVEDIRNEQSASVSIICKLQQFFQKLYHTKFTPPIDNAEIEFRLMSRT